MAVKGLTIRIDGEIFDKLHAAADDERRSANSRVFILIRDCIENLEKRAAESRSAEEKAIDTDPRYARGP